MTISDKQVQQIVARKRVRNNSEYQEIKKIGVEQLFQAEGEISAFWGVRLDNQYFVFCANPMIFFSQKMVGKVGIHSHNIVDIEATKRFLNG